MRKFHKPKAGLPQPRVGVANHGDNGADWMDGWDEIELLVIGWGSTKDVIGDVMRSEELRGRRIAHLHYTYLWPLCTEVLEKMAKRSKRIVLVEQNYQSQLGMLIRAFLG
jgi:2-oxoglutarate/2-oxoacid ferredoxin oxidoreductase subunit alpha